MYNPSLSQLEVDIMLSCIKSGIDISAQQKLHFLLQQKVDWNYLISISIKHKIFLLVYSNLNKAYSNLIPDHVHKFAYDYTKDKAMGNLLVTQECLKITNLFHKNQIKCLPLKGPIVAQMFYGDLALRTFGDLDLLVRKSDFEKAQQILADAEYQPSKLNNHKYYQQVQYYPPNIPLCIDLHYEFSPKNHFTAVNSQLFWHDLTKVTFADQTIEVFSVENALIYLCLEGAKEHWRSLNRLCDIYQLVLKSELDWEISLTNASLLNRKKAFLMGLYILKTIFKISLPDFINRNIEHSLKIKLSKKQICTYLFRRKLNLLLSIQWHLFNLQVFELIDIVRYIFHVMKVNLKLNNSRLNDKKNLNFVNFRNLFTLRFFQ
ncbi:MAG: nucleotidyltransferase family protein [Cyanobacteria bacterium J06621_8]